LLFEGGAVGVAKVGVDVDFADADLGGALELLAGGAAAAVQADVDVDRVADLLEQR
jgi:hypothetical protein